MIGIKYPVELLQTEMAERIRAVNVNNQRRRMVRDNHRAAGYRDAKGIIASSLLVSINLYKTRLAVEDREIGRSRVQASNGAGISIQLVIEASVGMQPAKAILPRAEQRQYVILALMSMAPDAYNTSSAGGCR
jgi:hypothetical protein